MLYKVNPMIIFSELKLWDLTFARTWKSTDTIRVVKRNSKIILCFLNRLKFIFSF